MGRDDWEEERAFAYLMANSLVPDIAAPKFALIEPDFDAGASQCICNTSSCFGILRGIAQEYGSGRLDHRSVAPRRWRVGLIGVPPTPQRASAYPNSNDSTAVFAVVGFGWGHSGWFVDTWGS